MKAGRSYMIPTMITLALIGALVWSDVCSAEEMKFGTIDMEMIYRNSARLRTLGQSLQQLQADSRAKLEAVSSDVEQIEKKLESEKEPPSAEEKAKLQAQLKEKQEALEHQKQAVRVQLGLKGRSVRNSAKIIIREAIAKVAKDKGFTAVFVNEALPYSEGLPDITPDVIKSLDSAPEIPTAPPAPKLKPSEQKKPGKPEEQK